MAVSELTHRYNDVVHMDSVGKCGKPNLNSGKSELVHRYNDVVHMDSGDKVLRYVRSDRGVTRGPRSEIKPKTNKPKSGLKVGRPRLFNGTQRAIMRGILKVHGLTRGQKVLAKERGIDVSLTVLRSVAKEFGVIFERGRPAA